MQAVAVLRVEQLPTAGEAGSARQLRLADCPLPADAGRKRGASDPGCRPPAAFPEGGAAPPRPRDGVGPADEPQAAASLAAAGPWPAEATAGAGAGGAQGPHPQPALPKAARYSKALLKGVLQAMGCKARHAHKVATPPSARITPSTQGLN